MDPPLSCDVFSGFVSRFDDVLALSSMDLSIFKYSPVSLLMILMHVHLIHPHHRFMILMMSLCNLILMIATGLTPIISLLMSEFDLLLMTLRQLTLVQ